MAASASMIKRSIQACGVAAGASAACLVLRRTPDDRPDHQKATTHGVLLRRGRSGVNDGPGIFSMLQARAATFALLPVLHASAAAPASSEPPHPSSEVEHVEVETKQQSNEPQQDGEGGAAPQGEDDWCSPYPEEDYFVDENEPEEPTTCSLCIMMKNGPCPMTFRRWARCTEVAKERGEDDKVACRCSNIFMDLYRCMNENPDYFMIEKDGQGNDTAEEKDGHGNVTAEDGE
eukprot:TRINITY_DN2432_c0_g1_i2.p1 TRINITY_DN2432_c0_g1~~TRINITY_DN2432_c0_g1_i2.p1  ORF type:complete len:233 (-),score=47.71 TRINITY_DN2432_c0_g1_i2:1346-2044(-)